MVNEVRPSGLLPVQTEGGFAIGTSVVCDDGRRQRGGYLGSRNSESISGTGSRRDVRYVGPTDEGGLTQKAAVEPLHMTRAS